MGKGDYGGYGRWHCVWNLGFTQTFSANQDAVLAHFSGHQGWQGPLARILQNIENGSSGTPLIVSADVVAAVAALSAKQ